MEHRLSFADAIIHSDGILEIITDAHIELSEQNVDEIQSLMHDHTEGSCNLLLNFRNSCSLAFGAIQALRQLKETCAIATLNRSNVSGKVSELIIPKDHSHPVNAFDDYHQALDWLRNYTDAN